jgi:hypothetical protein
MERAEAWRSLGYRRRMVVLHHARQGRPYPDAGVAAIALRWAQWWRARPLLFQARAALWFTIKLCALVGLVMVVLVLTGGEVTIGDSGSIWASAASTPMTTLVIVAARVLFVTVDASKVERANRVVPVEHPVE